MMKRFLSIIFAAIFVITACVIPNMPGLRATAVSYQILPDGGFEEGASWSQGRARESAAFSGEYVVRAEGEAVRSEKLSMPVSTVYTLSFWYLNESADEGDKISVTNADGNAVVATLSLGQTSDWKQGQLVFTSDSKVETEYKQGAGAEVPHTGAYIELSGTVAVDCMAIAEKTSPENLVKNGDFERGLVGWRCSNGTAPLLKSDPHDGFLALQQPAAAASLYSDFNTYLEETYTVSFFYKGDASGVVWGVRDQNGTDIGDGAYLEGSPLENVSSWTQVTADFTTGDSGELRLVFSTAAEGSFAVDSVVIRQSDSTNLVKNGGFEEDRPTVDTLPVWECNDIWTPPRFDSICDSANSGNHSLSLYGSRVTWCWIRQTVTVEPQTDYVLSFYIKGSESQSLERAMTGNNEDNVVTAWIKNVYPQWTKESIEFNSGSNTSYTLRFKVNSTDGTYLLDDVSVRKKPKLAEVSSGLVKNGGFESELESWNAQSGILVVDSLIYSGDYSLQLDKGYNNTVAQEIPLTEPKAQRYKLSFWYTGSPSEIYSSYAVSTGSARFSGEQVIIKGKLAPTAEDDWEKVSVVFEAPEDVSSVWLSFQSGENAAYYIDDVSLLASEEPADEFAPSSEPYMTALQGATNPYNENGPYITDEQNNLITDFGFENGNGNWNVPSFINESITRTDASQAVYEGSGGLRFQAGATAASGVFYTDVEPNTDYCFTAFVKMPTWSPENTGAVTFGVIDPENGKYLIRKDQSAESNRMLTVDNQLNPASPDDEWHIIGVRFNTGGADRIGVRITGHDSLLYFDNMYLFPFADAQKYLAPIQERLPAEALEGGVQLLDCDDSKNMVQNGSFGSKTDDFWQAVDTFGKNNAVVDSGSSIYGNALLYENNARYPDRTYYIRWVDIEPDTTYTFSAKYCIVKPQPDTYFGIISGDRGNITFPTVVKSYSIGDDGYDVDCRWQTAGFNFASRDCDRIGIVIFNGGGKAYIDDVRLFETYDENGKENGKPLAAKSRASDIPTKLESSAYNIEGGTLTLTKQGVTLEELLSTFKGRKYIAVYDANGNLITDLTKPAAADMEIRLMDGPEILDRVSIAVPQKQIAPSNTASTPQKGNSSAGSNSGSGSGGSSGGNAGTSYETVVTNSADNNLLAELVVENAEISPEFTPENKKYSATVPYEVEELIVRAVPQSEKATVSIEGTELTYIGNNIVSVIVHSESGKKRTYKITMKRNEPQGKGASGQGAAGSLPAWAIAAIIAGAALLLAAVIVIIVLLVRKRKKNTQV